MLTNHACQLRSLRSFHDVSNMSLKKIIKFIITPRLIGGYLLRHYFSHNFSDNAFVKLEYLFEVGSRLDLQKPKTYNEKLQWQKLNNIHLEYSTLVDKYMVKEYVGEKIGMDHIIPTLGVWEEFDEIEFSKLPNQFVIKTTHDSGGVVIIKEKTPEALSCARKIINKSLKRNYYYEHREYPYKNVKPRIIVEKYMVDESGTELKDYKIFCFDGEPKAIQVDYDRFVEHKRNMYDTEWNRLPFTLKFPTDWSREFDKPKNLDKMLEIASILSYGYPHLRVDLYNINGRIYFGELTFFHGSGFEKFTPEDWNMKFGNWIKIPR